MKKSLVAAAVLATMAAGVQAQSNVTLYGIVDVAVGSFENGAPGTKSVTEMRSGGLSTSRWGIKGSEDLGGGLKAVFKLESAIDVDSGSSRTPYFGRSAYVGLAGGFGEVIMGKVWTAMDDVYGAGNSGFDGSRLAISNVVWESANYADIPDNGIKYSSPSFGGFSGAVSYSLDETAGTSENVTSFQVNYAAGPLAVALAYQEEGAAVGADRETTMLNGSYDFGVAKLIAAYGTTKAAALVNTPAATKANDYHIGVDVPLSSALSLSGGYASSKAKAAGATVEKTSGFGIAAKYTLSKRTTVYAGLRDAETEDAAGTTINERKEFLAGINHAF